MKGGTVRVEEADRLAGKLDCWFREPSPPPPWSSSGSPSIDDHPLIKFLESRVDHLIIGSTHVSKKKKKKKEKKKRWVVVVILSVSVVTPPDPSLDGSILTHTHVGWMSPSTRVSIVSFLWS